MVSKNLSFAELEQWLDVNLVTEIECLVPDLTGVARGKILPRQKFTEDRGMRLPEAVAPDGLVEAFSMPGAAGFNLCVQWHPEWHAADNPVSMLLFQAFGAAVRQYRDRARVPLPGSAALA